MCAAATESSNQKISSVGWQRTVFIAYLGGGLTRVKVKKVKKGVGDS